MVRLRTGHNRWNAHMHNTKDGTVRCLSMWWGRSDHGAYTTTHEDLIITQTIFWMFLLFYIYGKF